MHSHGDHGNEEKIRPLTPDLLTEPLEVVRTLL